MRKLREALGLNQVEFGDLIGRSHQSVLNYEGGRRIPQQVQDRVRMLAQERGLSHLVDLAHVENTGYTDAETVAHKLLDEIYRCGSTEDINGITVNLANFVEAI